MSVAAICRNMLENLLKVPSNSEKRDFCQLYSMVEIRLIMSHVNFSFFRCMLPQISRCHMLTGL